MDDPLDLIIPPDLEAGVYADSMAGWTTRHQITLDFVSPLIEGGVLASRVKMPATAAFDVLRSLESAISKYELEFGEIRRPRRSGEE